MKILIVGVDGATWSVMKPLIDQGKLPNFRSVMMEGSAGNLETIDAEKFLSPALWTSIETGKHPDKHGIKDFYTTTRHDVKVKRLYQMLDGIDDKIGQFRWYCTWPPEKNKGFTVPSWVARTTETHPPELEFITTLSRHSTKKGYTNNAFMCLKYGVGIRTILDGAWRVIHKKLTKPERRDWYCKERLFETKMYGDIFIHLHQKCSPNYATILFGAVDALQHQYWKYFESEGFNELDIRDIEKYQRIIPAVYIEVDRFIGKVQSLLSEDDLLVIVSDHGMHSMRMERGSSRPYQIKATSLLRFLKLDNHLTSFSANFNTCIMLRNTKNGNNKNLIREAVEIIKKIKTEKSRELVFNVTSIEEDRFFIKFNDRLKYTPEESVSGIHQQSCTLYDLIIDRPEVSACHHPEGIFIMKGPHIKKNEWIENAKLLDIAPTILRLFNMPVARDMDGKVLEDIIKDDYLAQYPLKQIDTYEDSDIDSGNESASDKLTKKEREELESRLRSLGYLN